MQARIAWLLLVLVVAGCATGGVREASRLPPPEPAVANAVLFRALSLVGTPYRGGGNRPETGFDCSGLVGYVFADAADIALPRTTRALAALDAPAVARGALAAGDLVLFRIGRDVSHVGIYVGDGRFVHAPSSGGTVRMDPLDAAYWRERFAGGRRVAR
jgi:cell wall-associated NlpC family hydrolase